jgi:hypothetical protein
VTLERLPFRRVWAVDFEFSAPPGERPIPLCCVARELRSGKLVRQWLDPDSHSRPPYDPGPGSLFVAYYSSADWGCHLALDWPMPKLVLDLYAEFRCLTSGLATPCGSGLLGALAHYGLDALTAAEKESMRDLAIRGGPYTAQEQLDLLDYCQADVDALARLLPVMLPEIDLPRALLRGRYMVPAARMEWSGVPIDAELLARLRGQWERIKNQLVAKVDADYGVYVPTGQRTINPGSQSGAAILHTATEWNIDPHRLADAVDTIWREERTINAATHAARRRARQLTGLTHHRIRQWEESYRDYSTYPHLDVIAHGLAGELVDLGIGSDLFTAGGVDDTDYAGRLWELLRDKEEKSKPKHHPGILNRAAELVAVCPEEANHGPMTFSAQRWADYLTRKGIPWPRLESGVLALDDDTFREMAKSYPEVSPIRELRHALSQLRLNELAVGSDGRNRCLLSAFRSRTGRNQPSNTKYIFGPSVWLRGLIRPEPGRAVAYLDWEQQEFGIAAALSGDEAMKEAYLSGDPYLAFAKQAGAVPASATKESHKSTRDLFKQCVLAVQYGMGEVSLANRIGQCVARARELLSLHRQTYPAYWRWSQAAIDRAMLLGDLHTVFGWKVHVAKEANARSLANFPMQANGAEMLRLACCLATERGIQVCAPIHDALLVEGPDGEIEDVVTRTQEAMGEASELVLSGFRLRSEAKTIRHPDRYSDERGRQMWDTVMGILDSLSTEARCPSEGHEHVPPWDMPNPLLIT